MTFKPTRPQTVIGIIANMQSRTIFLDDVSLFKCAPPAPPSPPRSPRPPSPPAGELLPDYQGSCDLVGGQMFEVGVLGMYGEASDGGARVYGGCMQKVHFMGG